MSRVYISSTYEDLKDYRTAVEKGLRQLQHTPVGMEDYTAEGSRPLAKCLKDVAGSDVYVGIFAWRYGCIPEEPANPDKLSITELELKTAIDVLGRERCLIFILDPTAMWLPDRMDSNKHLNDDGKRIEDLRNRLKTEFLTSWFKSEDNLAQLVNTSVAKLPPPPERHARQLEYDIVIAFAEQADQALANALAEGLSGVGLNPRLVPRALSADSALDLRDLEREVVQSHSALVLLTPTALGLLKAQPGSGERVVRLLHERTDAVICALLKVAAADLPAGWPSTAQLELGDTAQASALIKEAIRKRSPTRGRPTVGLPYIVLSMTDVEAADLFTGKDPGSNGDAFKALLPALKLGGDPVARYGRDRRDWKPFGVKTVQVIAGEIAGLLNAVGSAPGQRLIKLQYYDFAPWLNHDEALAAVYGDLLATGCIVVLDQISLFHSGVGKAIAKFLGRASNQVAVVAMSTPTSLDPKEMKLMEQQACERLAGVFTRFEDELDPACEFGVAEERRLRRWLRASVPATVDNLAELRPDQSRKRWFRELTAPDRRMGAEALLWPDRAG